ncbi:putative sodium-coupled neutral amino acid transporter 10 [Euwallacea similis]|uniref:putative sodium-coupled neutral amino acid transporter 10 n=1 Tax=Euwallacea similis TaxID=1736056 RepID=UPI00344D3D87
MEPHSGYVLTLANSIIGVSILAMPYCFKQCGILLAIVLLLLTSIISRLSCHFLIKSAIMARRKNFEYLAYYIFGSPGKFTIEIGIIGFLIGTCIAFFVVMGDLGPELVSEITRGGTSKTMRVSILIVLTLFCVLPLGFLRNIDSLAGVTKATIGFYFCFVVKIVIDAIPHVFHGDWVKNVEFWRPSGILQSLPIFSTALSCQTQLFEIYHIVQNPSLEKMNQVINSAVNICTVVYLLVGLFGYIAFVSNDFSGNILLSFSPSLLTNIIKMGFILSVAFSFPLVIFPCRASLNSLIYKQGILEGTTDYIPEARFKGLTLIIVFVSLVIGILIPNIEFVLALIGSSIGIMICVLFPVICFISISQRNTNERLLAKFILFVGFTLMVLATYENLHHLSKPHISPVRISSPSPEKDNEKINENVKELEAFNNSIVTPVAGSEVRHEPPQPIEPLESQLDSQDKPKIENGNSNLLVKSNVGDKKEKEAAKEVKNNDNVDIEAIKKEEKETLLEQNSEDKDTHLEEHKLLIDKIQKQNEVQQEIVKQQKKLIEVIEKQQEKKEHEEKLEAEIKAVKEIESIALKAIEKISGDMKQNEQIVAKLEKDVLKKLDANVDNQKNSSEMKPPAKIQELKLMNNMLSAKIKENNLTNANIDKMTKSNQNKDNAPNSHAVVENPGNNKQKPKNVEQSTNDALKITNDSAKLSREYLKNMLPLPLAASGINQAQYVRGENQKAELKEGKIEDTNISNPKESFNMLKRDILAFIPSKSRR